MAPGGITAVRVCPLCGSAGGDGPSRKTQPVAGSDFLRCARCSLVFRAPEAHLSLEAEREFYLTHENDPYDPGYRKFLGQLAEPLIRRLAPGAEGLDYGCGPGPALPLMLQERGLPTLGFDPFFARYPALLERSYDFVTCTETAEHFRDPAHEFAKLRSLLRPGGWLAVMTQWYTSSTDFKNWRYARDPTHVCFYSAQTFEWLGAALDMDANLITPNICLLQRHLAD